MGGEQGQGPQFMESDSAFESESKSETETESESELSWQTAGGNSQAKDCVFGIGICTRGYGGEGRAVSWVRCAYTSFKAKESHINFHAHN